MSHMVSRKKTMDKELNDLQVERENRLNKQSTNNSSPNDENLRKAGGDSTKVGHRDGSKRSEGEHLQKGKARTTKKELLELIQHKNEMLQDMERKIKELTEQLKNKEDRLIRLAAEYDNYRKRSRREWELQKKQAGAELVGELLGVIDDFYRAFESTSGKDDNFTSGIKLIFTRILDVLKKSGVSEIESLGKKFDPRFHEAIGHVETDEYEEGQVAQVVQRGYTYHDQVLRPARVLVAKKKSTSEPGESKQGVD